MARTLVPASPPLYVPLVDLHAACGGARQAQRWAAGLPAGQLDRTVRPFRVASSARLPGGQTVAAWVMCGQRETLAGRPLPPGHESWNDADRQRFLDTCGLVDAWDGFLARQRGARAADVVTAFAAEQGAWAAERGLRVTLRSLARYRRRLADDGNVDRRGRPPADEDTTTSPEAWELFRSLYLGANALPLTAAWRYVAGEAPAHDWTWPGLAAIRRRVKAEIPRGARTLKRRGGKAFEAGCVPKIRREFDDVPAGEWWCLDGRVLDCWCRVPDSRKEWRRVRPVVTGVLDMRSRCLRVDLRATESSDGILAGIKLALLDWGAPTHVIVDNGEAYKAALGNPRGTPRQRRYLDDPAIGSAMAQLGVTVHTSLPYHSWAKGIESTWHKFKAGFDRWFWHFWGGTPAERPQDRDKLIKQRIDDLPTEQELRDLLAVYLDEYHATEQSGAGTRGLSPNLVMEQYRGTVRRVKPELADLLCSVTRGPLKVGRDGIRHNHIIYGQTQPEVWRLQGQDVLLRIDPDRCDVVTVCELDGTPLVVATNERLSGATQEQRREAARTQARYRKQMRGYAQARDFVAETPTQQILESKRRHALAREAQQRAALPDAETPEVRIVRGDLAASAADVAEQVQRHDRRAANRSSKSRRNGFDKLAEQGAGHVGARSGNEGYVGARSGSEGHVGARSGSEGHIGRSSARECAFERFADEVADLAADDHEDLWAKHSTGAAG